MKNRVWKMYQGMSIKTKWIIFVIILVLYPMILIGYVGYANYEQAITRHFIEAVQKDVFGVNRQFQEDLQDLEKFSDGIQQDEAVYKFTSMYYSRLKDANISLNQLQEDESTRLGYDRVIKGDYELTQLVTSYLKSLIISRQDISMVAYQFAEGGDFGYLESRDKAYNYQDVISFNRNKIFENMSVVLQEEKVGYYVDLENNIYIGKKIFYRTTGRHCGTVIFKLDLQHLMRKYYEMMDGANEAVYALAGDSQEILSLGNLSDQRKSKLVDFMGNAPRTGIVYKEENRSQAVIYNTFKEHNLYLGSAVYISTDILLADIRAMSRLVFLLCMSILPIFLLLANKLYKEIIYPVYVLSEKMQQIENGEMGVEVKSNRTDEFGYVFTSFNRMSRQLQYLVNCVYKEQIALKNAELKSLRAQINPHFLYNTLEMINWKARMSGQDDISEMIEALSGIMEINIDRRDSHFLTLQEEVDYISNYIFLIQKRYGDRVRFRFDVEEELMQYRIPKLILQPLVENAMTHGLERVGEGLIHIAVNDEDDSLIVGITDNGKGIQQEKLTEIKCQLSGVDKKKADPAEETKEDLRGHVGILNVHRRIQLLYGKTYGLTVESQYEKGTTITIKLPKTETGEMRQ